MLKHAVDMWTCWRDRKSFCSASLRSARTPTHNYNCIPPPQTSAMFAFRTSCALVRCSARCHARGLRRVRAVKTALAEARSVSCSAAVAACQASTLASLPTHPKARRKVDRCLERVETWAAKLPRGGLRQRAEAASRGGGHVAVDDAEEGVTSSWHQFDAPAVSSLRVDMLGGNVTVVTDPALADGQVWVINRGQTRMTPDVQLGDDGCLTIGAQDGVSSFIGQSEPVHAVVVLPQPLAGDMNINMKLGEVWLFGRGLDRPGQLAEGSDSSCGTLAAGACAVSVGLGDATFVDATPPSARVDVGAGDCNLVWRYEGGHHPAKSSFLVQGRVCDVNSVAHASLPLHVTGDGSQITGFRPDDDGGVAEHTVLAEASEGEGVDVVSTSLIGDPRVWRFA